MRMDFSQLVMFRGANISGFGTFQEINSTRGQLNLSLHEERGSLVVFVSEARDLAIRPNKRSSQLDTYVKLYLTPDPAKRSKMKSGVVKGTRNPNYRQSFSFQISDKDRSKRLYISVWQREMRHSTLGCMSFQVEEITMSDQGEVSGWFYLLEPGYGDCRNFPVDSNPRHSSVSQVPKGVRKSVSNEFPRPGSAIQTRTVVLRKTHKGGYGLTLSGQGPPVISGVSRNSPAELANLQKGDSVLKVQETDTSKSTANHVMTVLKACQQQVKLVVQRSEETEVSRSQAASAHLNPPPTRRDSSYLPPTPPVPPVQPVGGKKKISRRHSDKTAAPTTGDKEPGVTPDVVIAADVTHARDPIELDRQEAVRAVIRLQRETVEFCRRAEKAYTQPLKSQHLTKYEHDIIFAPVNEFVSISEGIQSNIEIKGREFLTKDTSQVVYLNVVGGIFTYDLEALVRFYRGYSKAKSKALELVSRCKETYGFRKFLTETRKKNGISLEEFLDLPGFYKSDVTSRIREVIMNTPPKHMDFGTMHHVVYSLDTLEASQEQERDLERKSLDTLQELKEKLVFSRGVDKFDICDDTERRYVGELELDVVGKKRESVVMVILSDLILVCVREPTSLRLKWSPISLKHVMVHDFNCVDERDFQLIIVDKETLQFRARDVDYKDNAKKMINERARGASTVRSRVQTKRSFGNPNSPSGEGDPWDIWDKDRKLSSPVSGKTDALFKSNLLSKEKKSKPAYVKPRSIPKSASVELQELMELHPISGEEVERWKEGLESLLKDPVGVFYLKRFMQKEHSDEHLRFYIECREFYNLPSSQLISKAEDIYLRYIKPGVPNQVNLDEQILIELNKSMRLPTRDVFISAQNKVFNLMQTHTYPRFIKSDAFDAILPSEI